MCCGVCKTWLGNADELTEIYCRNIERCAEYGIKCITYNFMPVFDWTRTQLNKEAPDGSTSLVMYMDQLKNLDPLKDDIRLPGWDSSYTKNEVRNLIMAYSELGEEGLWKSLKKFLKKVIPTAEKCGVQMAIHPDDPPYPIFGLPRIITDEKNIDRLLGIVESPANSLCLCTGSLGSGKFNDVTGLVRKYSKMGRIAFMHIRQVKLLSDGSFEECGHISKNGSLDMYQIVKALTDNGFDGYVRPDHGRMIWGETGKPGYGLYDWALGAAYINGLFEACEKAEKE
ncbi:MAG: mannonate dehydratase [Clostridiales bacterium]|nr:mannonate dehydratase [Clostridiales bacterium]